jgi:hypothetical protein
LGGGELRQENLEFKVSLGYILISCLKTKPKKNFFEGFGVTGDPVCLGEGLS